MTQLLAHDDIHDLVHEEIGVIVNAAARHHDLFKRSVTAATDGYWADSDTSK